VASETGLVTVVVDDRVLAEYADVLGHSASAGGGAPRCGRSSLPRGGRRAAAALLVTGNPRHFQPTRGSHQVELVAPAALLGRLAGT
jgi:hypothetical protein